MREAKEKPNEMIGPGVASEKVSEDGQEDTCLLIIRADVLLTQHQGAVLPVHLLLWVPQTCRVRREVSEGVAERIGCLKDADERWMEAAEVLCEECIGLCDQTPHRVVGMGARQREGTCHLFRLSTLQNHCMCQQREAHSNDRSLWEKQEPPRWCFAWNKCGNGRGDRHPPRLEEPEKACHHHNQHHECARDGPGLQEETTGDTPQHQDEDEIEAETRVYQVQEGTQQPPDRRPTERANEDPDEYS